MSEREETFEEASGPVPEDAMTAAELAPAFANDIARAAEETLAEAPSEAGRLSRRVAGMELGGLLMVAAALVAAIVSATVLADHFSSPDAWTSQIASLNARAETATGLVTVATALSAGISLIPGDFGAPIAEKLVELSVDLGVVLAAIYLEKCLLTIFSLAAFRLLVPLSCALAVAAVVASGRLRWDQNAGMQALLRSFALRLAVFAVAGFLVVPASVMVPDVVQATYRADVETVTAAVASAPEESPIEEPKAEEAAPEPEASEQTQEDRNVLDSFISWVQDRAADATTVANDVVDAAGNAVQTVTDGAKSFIESAKNVLNRMIEAFAVMAATCCVIPIVTLLFFVWLANTVLGLGISMPDARGLRGTFWFGTRAARFWGWRARAASTRLRAPLAAGTRLRTSAAPINWANASCVVRSRVVDEKRVRSRVLGIWRARDAGAILRVQVPCVSRVTLFSRSHHFQIS